MALYNVISPSWNDNLSPKYLRMIVPFGYRETGFDRVVRLLVSLLAVLLGVRLGLGVGTVGGRVVVSQPRMDWSVVIALARSCWLLKIGEGGGGGAFSTANRSVIINNKRSVAVIVGSAHVVGKKSTVFDTCSFFDSLIKHM